MLNVLEIGGAGRQSKRSRVDRVRSEQHQDDQARPSAIARYLYLRCRAR